MYRPRFIQKYLYVVFYVIFSALWFFVNILKIPILNFTYFVVSTLLIGAVVFQVKRVTEFLQITVFIILYAACDDLLSSLLSLISNDASPVLLLIKIIAIQTMIFVLSRLLIAFFKRQRINIVKGQFVVLIVIMLLSIASIYIITLLATYRGSQTVLSVTLLLMAVISGFLNLAIFYIIDNMSKSYRLENDLTLMKQQMDMQYQYYRQLEAEYDNSQKIVHDIKNHIRVMERLYQEDRPDGELEYTKQINQIVDRLGLKFKCGNKILNIIMNEKIRLCDLNQIEFLWSVENVDFSFMEDIDITAIFANLLDNAIEACKKIVRGKKFMEIRIYHYNDMVIINLVNSIESVPERAQGEFVSSKREHKAVGLSNVKEAVKKYSGDLNISVEQNEFSVSIIFPDKPS
jgi:sensor histidine kinase YesM